MALAQINPQKLLKEREKARKKVAPKGRQAKKIAATKRKQSYSSPCQDRKPSFWRHQSGKYYSVGQRAVQKIYSLIADPL